MPHHHPCYCTDITKNSSPISKTLLLLAMSISLADTSQGGGGWSNFFFWWFWKKKIITNSYFTFFYVYMSKCRQFEGLSTGIFTWTIPNHTIKLQHNNKNKKINTCFNCISDFIIFLVQTLFTKNKITRQ